MSEEYEVSRQNKVRQIPEKAAYDKETVHKILDSALLASVGFVQDGQPIVVPMLYGREGEVVFLHGARKARVIRLLEGTSTACMNVTHVDALVYARSAFNSSMNYRSATVFGSPRLVEDPDEKLHALRVITECTMPGRWDELREPLENEIKQTGNLGIQDSIYLWNRLGSRSEYCGLGRTISGTGSGAGICAGEKNFSPYQ